MAARHAGFTLVEVAIVLVLTSLLAAIAVPTWSGHLARARRADAVAALTRLQAAQEQYRSVHGLYASRLELLKGASAATSTDGFYEITLSAAGAEGFSATARARPGGPQVNDGDCHEIRLQIRYGLATREPSHRCWNL